MLEVKGLENSSLRRGVRPLTGTVEGLIERHHEIARRLFLGERIKDIAEDLKMGPTRVSTIAKSPAMQEKLAHLKKQADEEVVDISKRLRELREDAVEALSEVLKKQVEPSNTSLRVRVAESILDRTGHGKHETRSVEVSLEQYVQQTLVQLKAEHSGAGVGSNAEVGFDAES
jgi:hypothetical protein